MHKSGTADVRGSLQRGYLNRGPMSRTCQRSSHVSSFPLFLGFPFPPLVLYALVTLDGELGRDSRDYQGEAVILERSPSLQLLN